MINDILFTEKQRFNQWWAWAIVIGINLIFLFGLVKQVFLGAQFGNNPLSNIGIILFFAGILLLTILFLKTRLVTLITGDGIYIRFAPFELKYRGFKWTEISKCYIRTYKPIKEFAGWGFRAGRSGLGYTVYGNQGIQLEFTDGRKILIGTNKPDEIKEILTKINQLKQ